MCLYHTLGGKIPPTVICYLKFHFYQKKITHMCGTYIFSGACGISRKSLSFVGFLFAIHGASGLSFSEKENIHIWEN